MKIVQHVQAGDDWVQLDRGNSDLGGAFEDVLEAGVRFLHSLVEAIMGRFEGLANMAVTMVLIVVVVGGRLGLGIVVSAGCR
jgi:hypothetical protein